MVSAKASPNIAFIKYWGKKAPNCDAERNIGLNPSLSMTLSRALTTCKIQESDKNFFQINHREASEEDAEKIRNHILRVCTEFSVLPPPMKIHSANNFPTGSGIASSASAYAALTFAVMGFILGKKKAEETLASNAKLISRLARQGSGSAARSIHGAFVKLHDTAQSLDIHWPLLDTILILDRKEKAVSSTQAHERILSSPLLGKRMERLGERIEAVENALHEKDLHRFGALIEEEALEIHRLTETSLRPWSYLSSSTRAIIGALKNNKNRDYYFTIDAGPNIHLISERPIKKELHVLCHDLDIKAEIWEDCLGTGVSLE